MSKVVFFKTLAGFGEASVDLDACPRRWQLVKMDHDHPDFPVDGGEEEWLYLTPEDRWVEHKRGFDPWEECEYEKFSEVSPAYVIQELGFRSAELPPDLAAALGPYQEASGPTEPAPAPAKVGTARKKPRKQGKAERCVGVYMTYVNRNETPPSISEIAREVGCDPGTASRALKKYEDLRKEAARSDAESRRRDPA